MWIACDFFLSTCQSPLKNDFMFVYLFFVIYFLLCSCVLFVEVFFVFAFTLVMHCSVFLMCNFQCMFCLAERVGENSVCASLS